MLGSWPRTKGSTARRLNRVTGPTVEPISFALQQSQLKIGNLNTSSFVIQNKIATARSTVEKKIRRCLVQQIWDLFIDTEQYVGSGAGLFPYYEVSQFGDQDLRIPEIQLPLPPTQSVLGVYVTDVFGNETLVDPSVYFVTKAKEPCRIRLKPGQIWPCHRGPESIRIRFAAGYSTPFTIATDSTIQASNHGLNNGDFVQFSSLDGSLPQAAGGSTAPGLQIGQSYTVTNLQTNGYFQVTDADGDLLSPDPNWPGTGFIGEIPAQLIEAMAMISGLNQAGEVPSRLPGVPGSSRLSPIELPLDPAELLQEFVWPWL